MKKIPFPSQSGSQCDRRTFCALTTLALSGFSSDGWSGRRLRAKETASAPPTQEAVVRLGGERELFLDDYLIESATNAEIFVHRPECREIVAVFDAPWEANGCNYFTILRDEEASVYRMYFHAWSMPEGVEPGTTFHLGYWEGKSKLRTAYWESRDGVRWERPNLGLFECEGTRENNVVLDQMGDGAGCHDFTPFIDANPDATPDARYKATGASLNFKGVWAYKSPDGIRWSLMSDKPVFTKGQFDSQNGAFWSPTEKKYVLYFRTFSGGASYTGYRLVNRATSDDFIRWVDEGPIQFPEGEGPNPREEFYTNQILPYYRAPRLYIGLPTRYVDNGLTVSTPLLPNWEERQDRMKLGERLGTAITDAVYISSRDGVRFRQSNDVFIAPGLRNGDNWSYGNNYVARHAIETVASDPDFPRELSLYATESAAMNQTTRLRRYSLRIDGFGSLRAKSKEGEATTKPFYFEGDELSLNASTSGAGTIRVEILDENGRPIPGYSLAESDPIYGDSLDRRVSWRNGEKSVSKLANQTSKLRFVLREADVYSLKFETVER